MLPPLSPIEIRVLGCLMEKERTTPENYPLSLNSLVMACNQTTNREPVTGYSEKEVERALDALRDKKLAFTIRTAGARVQKYRHNLPDHYTLERGEEALLCVLMLRGPQTPGELRIRSEKFFSFGAVDAVEQCLQGLASGNSPLVRILPPRPGQKETRAVQLLSGPPETQSAQMEPSIPEPSPVKAEESEIALLRRDLEALREEFQTFRKQFE